MAESLLDNVKALPFEVRQYMLITGNYWAFTITDGALRMLVVMYFHQLGYSPLQIAMLFLFYEAFGVVTNLVGGWLGARLGLNRTMNVGLGLQIVALAMLMVPAGMLTVVWVMAAQALSGIAKDLNKMSAKSAVKVLVPATSANANSALYRWVAMLTGSKNALKGLGFFVGGVLLTLIGFRGAVIAMAIMLGAVLLLSLWRLKADLGKQKVKPKFYEIFSKSRAINVLSAARFCLFASRDVWFVVALPVFLYDQHGWSHWTVGGLLDHRLWWRTNPSTKTHSPAKRRCANHHRWLGRRPGRSGHSACATSLGAGGLAGGGPVGVWRAVCRELQLAQLSDRSLCPG